MSDKESHVATSNLAILGGGGGKSYRQLYLVILGGVNHTDDLGKSYLAIWGGG